MNHSAAEITDREISPSEAAEHRWFSNLVQVHGAAVLGVLRRLCRNVEDAEDAFQETAVRIWRFRKSQQPVNVRAWLMTVAYHAFLDQQTRRKRQSGKIQEQSDQTPDGLPDPRVIATPDLAATNELIERIHLALRHLPDTVREVVTLHYTGGLSLSDTAKVMQISEGTVKSRLNTALKQLRSVLQ